MPVNQLQIPGYATPQSLDFTSLANLGQIYKAASTDAARKDADAARKDALSLANLGNGSEGYSKAIGSLAALGDLDGAAKIASIQKTLAPENSADIQAFKLAQSQGFTGGILDFMKQKAEAGAARTYANTNIQSGEKEFDKGVAKDYADTFVGYQKAGRDSVGAINNLTLMDNLTRDPNFYSGAGGETVTKAKQIAASLGIADAASAAPNELFQKIASKSVLDASGGSLGNGFSNADRVFMQGTNANISNTPEGNRQIIRIAKRIEQRKQETAQFARDYAKKNGGRIDAGFDEALAKWAEANPAFPQSATPPAPKTQPQTAPRQAPDGKFYVPDPARPGKYLQVIQ